PGARHPDRRPRRRQPARRPSGRCGADAAAAHGPAPAAGDDRPKPDPGMRAPRGLRFLPRLAGTGMVMALLAAPPAALAQSVPQRATAASEDLHAAVEALEKASSGREQVTALTRTI